jgi:hypothetical protein
MSFKREEYQYSNTPPIVANNELSKEKEKKMFTNSK